MRKLIYFLALSLCLVACKREYKIYDYAEMDHCLTPVEVKAKVQYMEVTFDWKVFADAKLFHVEIYSPVPAEGEEPDPTTLIDEFDVTPRQLPYTYTGPEDMRCFYRIKATSPDRGDSRWATGTFKTDVDPRYTCATPSNLKASVIWDMVVLEWDIFPNVTKYELEVYDHGLPAEGDPDPANLVKSEEVAPDHVPDSLKFSPNTQYYYRVRSTAPGTDLKPSKWVRGAFKTTEVNWPTDEKALNVKTTQNYSGTDDNGNPSPFTAGGKANTEVMTLNGFTYGVKCMYYGNRVTLPTGNASMVDNQYGASIPTGNYFSFKICKPGTIETYFTRASETAKAEACVVLLTDKGDGKQANNIYYNVDIHPTGDLWSNGKTKDKVVVKEGDLYGITEAATVYIYAGNQKGMHVFQVTWTPDE